MGWNYPKKRKNGEKCYLIFGGKKKKKKREAPIIRQIITANHAKRKK